MVLVKIAIPGSSQKLKILTLDATIFNFKTKLVRVISFWENEWAILKIHRWYRNTIGSETMYEQRSVSLANIFFNETIIILRNCCMLSQVSTIIS